MVKRTINLDPEDLRRWYVDEGLSIRQIGDLAGVHYSSVKRHLAWAGIPRREPGCNPPPPRRTKERVEEYRQHQAAILAAFAADPGSPVEETARRLGCSANTVRNVLNRAGAERVGPGAGNREKVRELYAQGLRGTQIDAALGWQAGRASRWQRTMKLEGSRPLPPADELRRLHDEVWSLHGLARALHVSTWRIKDALLAAGIELHEVRRPVESPLAAHAEDLRRAYIEEGVSVEDLAQRYSVGVAHMRKFLERQGAQRTPRLTLADHERIKALAAEGLSNAEIARRMGCSGTAVGRHLRITEVRRVSRTAQPRAAAA